MSGLLTIFKKELADHFASWRFIILFILILLVGIVVSYRAAQNIIESVSDPRFVFLSLFTFSTGSDQSQFLWWMMVLIPIVGIALGFDAINGERSGGTMSRLVSQPIYRDTIINGKFMAGMVTIAIMMISIVLLIAGFGMRIIGLPPTSEEVARLLFFLVVSVVYGSFWMALAVLFSIFFRRIATSALASVVLWVFFMFFFSMIASAIAGAVAPVGDTLDSQLRNAQANLNILHLSPIFLFQEAMVVLLAPGERTISQLLQLVAGGNADFLLSNPLSLGQSAIMVWPQMVGLLVLTVLCFAVSYVRFMREEIRST